jgi:NADH:ubiquinone oxidoreductase subunit F (NADH-binding)
VPCRLGSQKRTNLGENLLDHKIDSASWQNVVFPIVKDLCQVMADSSICGLGRSVPVPVKSLIDFFGSDLQKHLAASGSSL